MSQVINDGVLFLILVIQVIPSCLWTQKLFWSQIPIPSLPDLRSVSVHICIAVISKDFTGLLCKFLGPSFCHLTSLDSYLSSLSFVKPPCFPWHLFLLCGLACSPRQMARAVLGLIPLFPSLRDQRPMLPLVEVWKQLFHTFSWTSLVV